MKRFLLLMSLVFVIKLVYCNTDQRKNVYNKDHLRDELHDVFSEDDIKKTDFDNNEMLELHYFKLHDANNDNKLDGLELGAAMTHYHDEDENGEKRVRRVELSDEELAEFIRQMLKDEDLNDDGYIDFFEFVKAQRRMAEG